MKSFRRVRPSAALAAMAAVILAACGTDTASPTGAMPETVSAVVLGSSNSYIVPGAPAGTFETYVANQVGRFSGAEYWDNQSDDGVWDGVSRGCAIGFYATDRMTNCNLRGWETPGSTANAAGNAYTYMWSDGVKAAAFTFNRGTSYTVTFRGAYSRDNSYVGYYVKTGSTYTFTEVPQWTTKTLNFSVVIPEGTGTWGFWMANDNVVAEKKCGVYLGKSIACSEAQGGQVSDPLQQFGLFANAKGTAYLVGAEDRSVLLSQGNDADYNDYIWTVIPTPPVCDFMTFGRTQIEVNGTKIVISGNAGGYNAKGIIGHINVQVGKDKYNVQDLTSYSAITTGPLSGSGYPNARRIVGTAKDGTVIEVRLYDGGEPGRVADAVYLKVGDTVVLNGVDLNRGNIQYHAKCRGPGDEDDDESDD